MSEAAAPIVSTRPDSASLRWTHDTSRCSTAAVGNPAPGSPSVVRAPFWASNRLTVIVGVLFIAGQVATFVDPGKGGVGLQVSAAVLLPCGIWLTYRAGVCATLIIAVEGLIARTLMRDRTWPWEDVARAEVVTAPYGAMAYTRLMLSIDLADRRSILLSEVNFSPRSERGQAALAVAADQINRFAAAASAHRP